MIEVYDLRQLPENGDDVEAVLDKSWLDAELAEGALSDETPLVALRDGSAKIHLLPLEMESALGPVVHVRGTVQACIATACVRCLSDIQLEIDTPVEWTLFPAAPTPKVRPGADEAAAPTDRATTKKSKKKAKKEEEAQAEAIDPESPEEATYSDGEIDLPSIVREAILLEVAMNPSCADEAGCADRTAALIAAVNPPEVEMVDPRWAALEALKDKLS